MPRTTYKKKITTPELIKQISPENQKLIKLFLREKNRVCSDETIKQYTSALNIFFCWNVLENDNKYYPKIKKIEISNFFDYLVNELKVNSKRFSFFKSVLSSLSDTFIKFYDEEDEYANFRNFINAVVESMPKSDAREKTILTDEECENLLETLIDLEKYQDACLFALAIYSGCRISELVQANLDWFNEDNIAYDVFYETPKIRTKGRGKTGKVISRLILKDPFKPYLDKWLEKRAQILSDKKIEDHGMLFINKQGQPASQDTLRGCIPTWEKILGKPYYHHCARHKFVDITLHKYKLSPDIIKNIVKWSSVDLVTLYNDHSDEIDMDELKKLKEIMGSEIK